MKQSWDIRMKLIHVFLILFIVKICCEFTEKVKTSEAYSAAFLTKAKHLRISPTLDAAAEFIPDKYIYCRWASIYFFHDTIGEYNEIYPNTTYGTWGSSPRMTQDVLGFSVSHLSWLERILDSKYVRQYKKKSLRHKYVADVLSSYKKRYQYGRIVDKVKDSGGTDSVTSSGNRARNGPENLTNLLKHGKSLQKYLASTVALVPVRLLSRGVGNSKVLFREDYFSLTLWSLHEFFEKIVVSVASEEDLNYMLEARRQGTLPIWDILFLNPGSPNYKGQPCSSTPANGSLLCNLNKLHSWSQNGGAHPVLSVLELRRCLRREDFCLSHFKGRSEYSSKKIKYVYYTEADQIIMWRDAEKTYEWARKWGRDAIITPHRLLPSVQPFLDYRKELLNIQNTRGTEEFSFLISTSTQGNIHDFSCCLESKDYWNDENKFFNHSNWKSIALASVGKIDDVPVFLGHVDFWQQTIRECVLTRRGNCE